MKKQKKKYVFLLLIPVGIVITLFLLAYTLFQISKSRTFQFFGGLTSRVETSEKLVALTLDDAPTSHTQEVLDALKARNVKATFYVIGQYAEDHPEELQKVVQEGHELGNHTYTHPRMVLKSQSRIDEEVQKTQTIIKEAGYQGEITFRPPNGKKLFGLPWYLKQQNIKTIMWDVEPDTYAYEFEEGAEKTQFLVNNAVENTQPGSIILMHPFCSQCTSDREAIVQIIDQLQSQGYQFVTVSELLQKKTP